MPNKRGKNKKLFGVSFDRDLVAEIALVCKERGIDRVEFLRQAAESKLKQEKSKNK